MLLLPSEFPNETITGEQKVQVRGSPSRRQKPQSEAVVVEDPTISSMEPTPAVICECACEGRTISADRWCGGSISSHHH